MTEPYRILALDGGGLRGIFTAAVLAEAEAAYGPGFLQRFDLMVIMSVAGDKDILVPAEWAPDDFEAFQRRLKSDTTYVLDAIRADSQAEADRLWKLAFGD
ncbi:hypothetical protein Mkiyose1088_41320 [Mycobacterium kiyosense]|uniref:hypothetical protein n=1 Tax=Mycobacterium kiyosense TaxID=2871094 RepID=UPI00216F643C|nr:hypothetical protein [Mycobacterium kiyosense]GLD02266.1 hypothetical protein Mkiyose1088_41320 [Mycobacterium kiyosense]